MAFSVVSIAMLEIARDIQCSEPAAFSMRQSRRVELSSKHQAVCSSTDGRILHQLMDGLPSGNLT
jgi:hypothetical protein